MSRKDKRNKYKNEPQPSIKHFPDEEILVEAAIRRGVSLTELIVPTSKSAYRIGLRDWKYADLALQNVERPNRNPMYRVYDDAQIDLFVTSLIDTRIRKCQRKKFVLIDKSKKIIPDAEELLNAQWFSDFIKHAMMWVFEGFVLIENFEYAEGKLSKSTRVNKYHVRPDKGIVVKQEQDEAGDSYLDPAEYLYYIPIGEQADYGLMRKISPIVLAIKFAIGQWGELNEKLGIPFRFINTPSADPTRQKQLAEILEKCGSAGYAVLNENEKLQLLELSNTDPTSAFEKLINLLDRRLAVAVNGESSISNPQADKGTYGSLKVMQDVNENIHDSDLSFLTNIINNELIPRLVTVSSYYAPLKNLRFDWDYSEDLSVADIVDITTKLVNTNKYKVDAKILSEKVGFEIQNVDIITPPAPPTPPKTTAAVKKKILTESIAAFYTDCCKHHHIEAESSPDFETLITKVAKKLYDGKHNGVVDYDILKQTAQNLREAVMGGFKTTHSNETSELIKQQLVKNVYVFSGFKSYQELNQISSMMRDADGNLRSWNDFKKDVLKINEQYNKNYLQAEYDNAVVSSQMAAQWQTIQATKKDLPYLRFNATLDGRTTQICKQLDGITLPADDSFWQTHYLPLHWHERSVITQELHGAKELSDFQKQLVEQVAPKINPMFGQNVGETGIAFPKSHPYYKTSVMNRKVLDEAGYRQYVYSLPRAEQFIGIYTNKKTNAQIQQHLLVDDSTDDYTNVMNTAKGFISQGNKLIEILPNRIYDKEAYEVIFPELKGTQYEPKCPDLRVDGLYYEHEGFNSKVATNAFKNMLNRGVKQSENIVIEDCGLDDKYMIRNIKARVFVEKQTINQVFVKKGNKLRLIYKNAKTT